MVIEDVVDIKGWKALGNRLIVGKVIKVEETEVIQIEEPEVIPAKEAVKKTVKPIAPKEDKKDNEDKIEEKAPPSKDTSGTQASLFEGEPKNDDPDPNDDFIAGDTLEFDIE